MRHERAEDTRRIPFVSKRIVVRSPPTGAAHGNGRQVWGVTLGGPAAGVWVAVGVVADQLLLEGARDVRGNVRLQLLE
eukprot:scaffold27882_cov61-Phaeocystis_antarctica.AAC.9